MKKVIILAAVAFAFGATSCKKDRVCSCTYVDPITNESTTDETTIPDSKKGDAEDACSVVEAGWKIIDNSASCELQ